MRAFDYDRGLYFQKHGSYSESLLLIAKQHFLSFQYCVPKYCLENHSSSILSHMIWVGLTSNPAPRVALTGSIQSAQPDPWSQGLVQKLTTNPVSAKEYCGLLGRNSFLSLPWRFLSEILYLSLGKVVGGF